MHLVQREFISWKEISPEGVHIYICGVWSFLRSKVPPGASSFFLLRTLLQNKMMSSQTLVCPAQISCSSFILFFKQHTLNNTLSLWSLLTNQSLTSCKSMCIWSAQSCPQWLCWHCPGAWCWPKSPVLILWLIFSICSWTGLSNNFSFQQDLWAINPLKLHLLQFPTSFLNTTSEHLNLSCSAGTRNNLN